MKKLGFGLMRMPTLDKANAALIGFLAVLCTVLLLAGGYTGYHRLSSAAGGDLDVLAGQAAKYFGTEEMSITKTAQRGDYLAALCADSGGNWYMCEYDRDKVFPNRWYANGGKRGVKAGKLVSWNYGGGGDAVLIFCGVQLPYGVYNYYFINSGVTYFCPVADHTVLDIFIIPDCDDISSTPVMMESSDLLLRNY